MKDQDKIWNKAVKNLVGLTIKSARYMTAEEAEEWGWYKRPVVIRFTNGSEMLVSADDEGNDGGSLFTNIKGLETIPTLS